VTGIGGEEALGVGEQEQQVGGHEVRHQRSKAVVVAVADLVVGHGVVLVDHGHHAEVEQPLERLARVQVLRTNAEVVGGEQHLPGDDPVPGEELRQVGHEQGLADRGHGLQHTDVGGALRERERGHPRGDRARAHQHDVVARGACGGDLGKQRDQRGVVQLPGLRRE
jgi:hypothetical protein